MRTSTFDVVLCGCLMCLGFYMHEHLDGWAGSIAALATFLWGLLGLIDAVQRRSKGE